MDASMFAILAIGGLIPRLASLEVPRQLAHYVIGEKWRGKHFKFFCTSLLGLAKISQGDAFYYWAVTVDTTDNAVWRY
jgi:hypothetical protein